MNFDNDIEIEAAAEAIHEYFGCVIGKGQSRNIAYQAVVAARQARRIQSAKVQVSNQGPATQARMAGRFRVD